MILYRNLLFYKKKYNGVWQFCQQKNWQIFYRMLKKDCLMNLKATEFNGASGVRMIIGIAFFIKYLF